jgi:serine/threonine protein kinase
MVQPNADSNQTGPHLPLPGPNEDTGGALPPGRGLAPPGHPGRIGRFEVRAVLGSGAFGQVYRGFDPGLRRDVAIKVPHRERLTPQFRERFLREARATATIHHPNVCPVHEVGADGELPFIVMHFVPGPTLAGLLERRGSPFPPRQAALVVRKLALGVAAAHDKGVIHRDLKPQNVLWDEASREVLVTDFGLARIGDTEMTAEGITLGTPAYMAPEQARGRQTEVGPLSDVYSLGVILYRVVTGVLPFQGSTLEVMAQAQFAEPLPPSAVRPGLDPQLDAICLKAMAKKPGDRFASARELAAVLTSYLRESERASAGVTEESLRLPPEPGKASGVRPKPAGTEEDRATDVVVATDVAPPGRPDGRPTTAAKPQWELAEDDESRPAPARRRARTGPGRGVVILGGVLLFAISVVVGGLLVADGKKPSGETTQVGEKGKKDGATAATKVDESKDPGKPPDKAPDPVPPDPAPRNPPVATNPAPGVPNGAVEPADGPQLPPKWTVALNPRLFGSVRFDRAGRYVVFCHYNQLAVDRYDVQTGAAGPKWVGGPEGTQYLCLPMDGSKFGFTDRYPDWQLHVWDAAQNKGSTIDIPPTPQIGQYRTAGTVRVSTNGRFMVTGRGSPGLEPGPPAKEKPQIVPLKVTDLSTGKAVVTLNWLSGTAHFTADSNRVLTLDATAQFRWFKLPSGQPDGEWTFGKEPSYYTSDVQGVSATGDRVLYYGQPPDHNEGYHLLDGRTGRVVTSFTPFAYSQWSGALSDDGQVVALFRSHGYQVDVFTASGQPIGIVKIDSGPMSQQRGSAFALSADGRMLAVYNAGTSQLIMYDLPAIAAGSIP